MFSRLRPLVLLVFIALTGCGNLKEPLISLSEARWGTVSDHAATANLLVRLQNPNAEPLNLLEFKYTVSVEGREVYRGTRAAEMTLAAQSVREVEIPAVFPFEKAGWTAGSLPASPRISVNGTLRYLQIGAIARTLLDIGARRPKASFNGQCEIMPGAPASAPAATAPGH